MTDSNTRKGALAPEVLSDRRADRNAYVLVGVMAAVSLAVQIFTRLRDVARTGLPISSAEIITLETTSHAVIFGLALLTPFLLDRAPVAAPWGRMAAIHAGAAFVFSFLHVSLMYALRLALFPLTVGKPYGLNLLAPSEFLYEFRKDAFTYVLIVFAFSVFRALGQQKLETEAAMAAARHDRKITLKSGGTSFIVSASDIITAKAAGNYVEVKTPAKSFLARMTISSLEKLLAEAGGAHARAHRSYIVNREFIREIEPSGNGAFEIRLTTGDVIPCSRNYRDALPGV
ncbi:MAG: LytTR family DNA-binding domain-containing protein [Parvularculaceae bacterium]